MPCQKLFNNFIFSLATSFFLLFNSAGDQFFTWVFLQAPDCAASGGKGPRRGLSLPGDCSVSIFNSLQASRAVEFFCFIIVFCPPGLSISSLRQLSCPSLCLALLHQAQEKWCGFGSDASSPGGFSASTSPFLFF